MLKLIVLIISSLISSFQIFYQTQKNIFMFLIIIVTMVTLGIFIIKAEYILLIYFLIYISATAVLFLFALVAINPKEEKYNKFDHFTLLYSAISVFSPFIIAFNYPFFFFASWDHSNDAYYCSNTIINNFFKPTCHENSISSSSSSASELNTLADHLYNNCFELVMLAGLYLTVTVLVVSFFNKSSSNK